MHFHCETQLVIANKDFGIICIRRKKAETGHNIRVSVFGNFNSFIQIYQLPFIAAVIRNDPFNGFYCAFNHAVVRFFCCDSLHPKSGCRDDSR